MRVYYLNFQENFSYTIEWHLTHLLVTHITLNTLPTPCSYLFSIFFPPLSVVVISLYLVLSVVSLGVLAIALLVSSTIFLISDLLSLE